ncbi:hypothetical protein BC829DRAFT_444626 [Chytridium lagenaria]|nr:hypothetical protein BC829DRAFT_444626 [Chytridium lagenaria]
MVGKISKIPDYEPDDLDDDYDDDETVAQTPGPSSKRTMNLGQNPFGSRPSAPPASVERSAKRGLPTPKSTNKSGRTSFGDSTNTAPRRTEPSSETKSGVFPISNTVFLEAYEYTREKMKALDVQQNFMLHEIYRYVQNNILYVDVMLKYVADHRMIVNVINNGHHIEYKIFPATLHSDDFTDKYTSTPFSARNKGSSHIFRKSSPSLWKPELFTAVKFTAELLHQSGEKMAHQMTWRIAGMRRIHCLPIILLGRLGHRANLPFANQ